MVLTMKTQNLQQKNDILLTVRQKVIIHTKIPSNFNKFIRIKSLWLFWRIYYRYSVTGNITVTRTIAGDPVQRKQPLDAATQVVFKNCAPFKNCRTEINDTFVDYADFINITMPMYNLIKYSDNYEVYGILKEMK